MTDPYRAAVDGLNRITDKEIDEAMTKLKIQLVGRGDVLFFSWEDDEGHGMSLAIKDTDFVKAMKQLTKEVRKYPDSALRCISVTTER